MSVHDQFAPYVSRFITLLQQGADAKLELICKDGKASIHIVHDFGMVVETTSSSETKPAYNDILKKNVKTSQFNRLNKRAEARSEQLRAAIQEQRQLAVNAKIELDKVTLECENAQVLAEEAKVKAAKAKEEALQANLEAMQITHETYKQKVEQASKVNNKTTSTNCFSENVHKESKESCEIKQVTIGKTKPDLNETLPLDISQKDSNYNSNSKITNLSRGKNPI